MTSTPWSVEFSPYCDSDIRNAGVEVSDSVCRAVVAFAATGAGVVEQDEPGGDAYSASSSSSSSSSRKVHADGGYALVYFSASERRIYVARILAYHPPPQIMPLLDDPIHDEPSED